MIISVLGTDYTIIKRKHGDDPKFQRHSIDGYCDSLTKKNRSLRYDNLSRLGGCFT